MSDELREPDDGPPFKRDDAVRHKPSGHVGIVCVCERRTCLRDVPWVVTLETEPGTFHDYYARDCEFYDDSAAIASAVRESFEDADEIARLRESVEQLTADLLQSRSEATRLRTVDECLRIIYRQLLLSVGDNFWAQGEGTLGECIARGIRELVEKVALCRDKCRPPPQWYSAADWETRLHEQYGMPKGPAHRTAKIVAEHCQHAFERGMYIGLGHISSLASIEVASGDRL